MRGTLEKLITPEASVRGTAALVQSLSLNARRFVLCLACVEEDIARYGESYWHRAHFLPGIVQCPVHECELYALPPGKHAGLPIRAGPTLAERRQATKVRRIGSSCEFEQELTRRCLAPLLPSWAHQDDWAFVYRQMALEKNYVMKDSTIAGSQIAMDMMKTIGPRDASHARLRVSPKNHGKLASHLSTGINHWATIPQSSASSALGDVSCNLSRAYRSF